MSLVMTSVSYQCSKVQLGNTTVVTMVTLSCGYVAFSGRMKGGGGGGVVHDN